MEDSTDSSSAEVTQLLKAWGRGDEFALGRLIPLVQKELHSRRDSTRQPCASSDVYE